MNEQTIFVLNAGSSSIKAAVYQSGSEIKATQINDQNPASLVEGILEWTQQNLQDVTLHAIGHRIVHGGGIYSDPIEINDEVVSQLEDVTPLDPEHMPNSLRLIRAMQEAYPDIAQIACFDTAFFHDLPRVSQILPFPRKYESIGLRRYGFHGLSYQSILATLEKDYAVKTSSSRIVCAHLGSGVSLAAIDSGKPLDTTMAMTPASGIPMSTRSGSIDPGVVKFLADKEGITAQEFNDIVNKASGLLGISETSADMYTLLQNEAQDVRAKEAVEVFCHEVKKSIGALTAVLGGLDVLVFAGGMGENAPLIRKRVCEGLGYIGVGIDDERNATNSGKISPDGTTAVYVVHTDEALVIVSQVQKFLDLQTNGRA